jgi:hypothetical protein
LNYHELLLGKCPGCAEDQGNCSQLERHLLTLTLGWLEGALKMASMKLTV